MKSEKTEREGRAPVEGGKRTGAGELFRRSSSRLRPLPPQMRPCHCVTVRGRGARTRAMQGRSRARAGEKPPLPSHLAAAATAEVTIVVLTASRVTAIHGGAEERECPKRGD